VSLASNSLSSGVIDLAFTCPPDLANEVQSMIDLLSRGKGERKYPDYTMRVTITVIDPNDLSTKLREPEPDLGKQARTAIRSAIATAVNGLAALDRALAK